MAKVYSYKDHTSLSDTARSYMVSVTGKENLEEISIIEINEFLNFIEEEACLPDEEQELPEQEEFFYD